MKATVYATGDAELDALRPIDAPPNYPSDWVALIPPGTLCYINALAGEVWLAQGVPARRWLSDMLEDAEAATLHEIR